MTGRGVTGAGPTETGAAGSGTSGLDANGPGTSRPDSNGPGTTTDATTTAPREPAGRGAGARRVRCWSSGTW